ncbi:MAG TPA: aspartate aminotransferase family protein [Candidatus Sulfotelmatobacter sp.]|nr:aspartate aminotransferase family protein [Candidatus Sulfotelmatobacter sp.]
MPTDSTAYRTDKSRQAFERATRLLIDGGSSPSRGPVNYGEYPIFVDRAKGSRLYDIDGNEYIDWMMGFGALPLGHADPDVTKAICEAAATGAHFATATEIEVEVAELLQGIIPNAEAVRFANTGTEAVMAAIRLARGYTGRPKILKFEGHYHGWYDDVLAGSNPMPQESADSPLGKATVDSAGLNRHALEDTIVIPWNSANALTNAFDEHSDAIAAVITEGVMANMGVIPPEPGYLESMQKMARDRGTLFILDETVTGFRIAPGGCQEYYKLSPDIVTLGKALGCGLPVAAFAGRSDIMQALAGGNVLHYGTHNASRIGLHAARASLRKLTANQAAAFRYIWDLADSFCAGITELFKRKSIPAIVQRVGPMFQIMFTEKSRISDYREYCRCVDRKRYQQFAWSLFRHGVYTSPAATLHSIVTVAHNSEDVEKTLAAMDAALS